MLFLLLLFAQAQQPGTPPASTFSSNAELVLVPVSVRDHYGQPLAGFQQSDFKLTDNGKQATIAVFEEVHANQAPQPLPSQDKQTYSNLVASPDSGSARSREPLILLMDGINSPLASQARAGKGLVEYLSSHLDAQQPTALLVLAADGIRQVHAFTNDTQALIEAAKSVQAKLGHTDVELTEDDLVVDLSSGDALAGAVKSLRIENAFRQTNAIRDTLNGFHEIAQAFAGVPGRKSLVWLSSGFPLIIDDPHFIGSMGAGFLRDYEDTWQALNKAEIAVYPVNLEALSHDPRTDPYGGRARGRTVVQSGMNGSLGTRPDREKQSEDTLHLFASGTGGRACMNDTNIADCIGKATADSRDYYLLGFYVPHEGTKPGWHKLGVKLDKPHGELLARSQYFFALPPAPDPGRNDVAMRNALSAPIQYSGLGMTVRPESVLITTADEKSKGISAKTSLAFRISIPADSVKNLAHQDKIEFDLWMLPVSAAGTAYSDAALRLHINLSPDKIEGAQKNGLTINQRLVLPVGSALVKVVALNQDGTVGSVFVPLSQK